MRCYQVPSPDTQAQRERPWRSTTGTRRGRYRASEHSRTPDNRPPNRTDTGRVTVPPSVARARFARFVKRALADARERQMTDKDIHRATGISPSTFHKWQSGEGGLPKWEKVAQFCAGLDIPVSAGAAALGISDRAREPEPEPLDDPDLRRLGRLLRDPNVSEAEKQAIRHTIRMLARATRTETDS